jgi:hypothetical protein
MSNQLFQCRICFEEEDNQSMLLSPCRCSGTSKYVHVDCLKMWIKTSENDIAKKKCMECRTAYKYTSSSLTESISMYNSNGKDIWKTYGKNCIYMFPLALGINIVDTYILYEAPIITYIYTPENRIYFFMAHVEWFGMLFYLSNSVFILNTRFFITYLYRIYRSIHRKNKYLKLMFFSMLGPLIGIMFFFLINKIIMSYDDITNLMTYNFLYIMVTQVLNYSLLMRHKEVIQNMNSNIEINILSYVDVVEIDIESTNLELIETEREIEIYT